MCKHKYVHIETKKWGEPQSVGNTIWYRVDIFYCENCAEIITKRQKTQAREVPDWY